MGGDSSLDCTTRPQGLCNRLFAVTRCVMLRAATTSSAVQWKGGKVAQRECNALVMRHTCKGIVGSHPGSPATTFFFNKARYLENISES